MIPRPGHRGTRSLGLPAAISLALAFASAGTTLAHGPDPQLGSGLWSRDEVVAYQWADGGVPPAWMATAIDLGAGDVGESRDSRAATFVRAASAAAEISYGVAVPCHSYGIACADRTGMFEDRFGVWFRPHNWVLDWGILRWCQAMSPPKDGCYDAERVALDELGHIEGLDHHVNFADESDYTDAIVQFAGRQRPRLGWDFHAFGRCDVARLQLQYERRDPANRVSTCLSLASALTITASDTALYVGDSVKFTATLKVTSGAAAGAMAGDPLSDRAVVLQRRPIGASTWTTIGTVTPSTSQEGVYSLTWSPTATYDWRAVYTPISSDGLLGSTTATVRVTVTGCSGTGCPQSAPKAGS